MESNFFKNQTSPAPQEEIKTQYTVVDYSDEKIIQNRILRANQLKPINKEHLARPVESRDISQGNIGNCYFLASLTAIVEYDVSLLQQIIVFKDNKFHVTLFDAKNPLQAYIYIVDPTKVIGEKSSDHTHDLIFILEKAYALHRIHLESRPLSSEEAKIKEIHILNKESFENTLAVLIEERKQMISAKRQQIESEMTALKNIQSDSKHQGDYDLKQGDNDSKQDDAKQKELLQYLNKHNWQINAALDDYLTKLFPERHIGYELSQILRSIKSARLDYATALSSGTSMQTFMVLLGNISIEHIFINEPYNASGLTLLLTEIAGVEPEYFSQEINNFLTRVFQDNSLAKVYFVDSIKNTPVQVFWNYLMDKEPTALKVSPQSLLLHLFQAEIKWLPNTQGTDTMVLQSLETFISNEVLAKRGTGKYTQYQLKLYEQIFTALTEGKLVTFGTRDLVSKNPNKTKGLLRGHSYFVANAFQKENLLFFEIRNVWNEKVREYFFKKKKIDNTEIQVLTAEEKKQLAPLFLVRSLDFVGFKASPRLLKKTKVAKPHEPEERSSSGFFSIELNDLVKRFGSVVIATPPPRNIKDTQKLMKKRS